MQSRVNSVFAKYATNLEVQQREVKLDEIRDFLEHGYLIVLIDSSKKNTIRAEGYEIKETIQYYYTKTVNILTNSVYSGHYILLTSSDDQYIYYLDPNNIGLKKIDFANFEICRKARGTDQDLIFIPHTK